MSLSGVMMFICICILVFFPGIITILIAKADINKKYKYIMPAIYSIPFAISLSNGALDGFRNYDMILMYLTMEFSFVLLTCILFDKIKSFKKFNVWIFSVYLLTGYFTFYYIINMISNAL